MFYAIFDYGFNKFPCKAYSNFVSEKYIYYLIVIKKGSYGLKIDNLSK